MELVLDRVSKQYQNIIAADRITLKLGVGVTGLLGANGAGKTTLMRMICGILKPTSGSISFDGTDVSEELYRDALGYLPQNFGYYPSFTGRDFLLYIAVLKGLDKKTAKRKSTELLKSVNLEEAADKKIRTYSGGMKQRLGIAQALLNDPRIIVLDEPTAGLDPKERVRFRNVSDVEHIADRILMMRDGQIIWDGTKENTPDDLEGFYLKEFGGAEDE